MSNKNWPMAVRKVYLEGGLLALSIPEQPVFIYPSKNSSEESAISFNLESYYDLFPALKSLNVMPIVIQYFESPDQLEGLVQPMTFPAFWNVRDGEYAKSPHELWRSLAHAGYTADNIVFFDLCSRVSFSIQACVVRLTELAEAYHLQIREKCRNAGFVSGNRFLTTNSKSVFLRTHSLFIELGTLRDQLAEFAAAYVFHVNKASTMAGLLRLLKSNNENHPLAKTLIDCTNESDNGWLARLGKYRDLIVHAAPLAQVTHKVFLVQRYLPSCVELQLPSMYFPMPSNPFIACRTRSNGLPFESVEEWIQATATYNPDNDNAPDALNYCYEALANMLQLAKLVASFSPIQPKRFTLTPESIISMNVSKNS
jgi:hypothetical protein